MPEFRKDVKLPAVRLTRADLAALAQLMRDGLDAERGHSNFSVSVGEATYSATSIEELLIQDLPGLTGNFSFKISGLTDRGNRSETSLHLSRDRSTLTVNSSDEIWFNGKLLQLTKFFVLRRRWYWRFAMVADYVFGSLTVATWLLWLLGLAYWNMLLMWSSFVFFCVFLSLSICVAKGYLFPKVTIVPSHDQDSWRGWREAIIILAAVCTIIGTLWTVIVSVMG